MLALVPLLLGRLADGLDGAVARASLQTDFGGYFDIAADFLFYGAIPLAFVILDPVENGVAGAFLLFSFYVNGASFLGYAILAEKRKMTTQARGAKSLYFTGGLLEGTETIAFFVALCLFARLVRAAGLGLRRALPDHGRVARSAGPEGLRLKGQIEKDVPQPQEEVAFGLSITKRAPISSSEKSITALARNGSETESTTTF